MCTVVFLQVLMDIVSEQIFFWSLLEIAYSLSARFNSCKLSWLQHVRCFTEVRVLWSYIIIPEKRLLHLSGTICCSTHCLWRRLELASFIALISLWCLKVCQSNITELKSRILISLWKAQVLKKNFKKLHLEILFSDLDYMCSPLKSLWENNTWYFFPFMSTYSGDIRDAISVLNLFLWKWYVLIIFAPQFFSEVLNTVPVSQSTGV